MGVRHDQLGRENSQDDLLDRYTHWILVFGVEDPSNLPTTSHVERHAVRRKLIENNVLINNDTSCVEVGQNLF